MDARNITFVFILLLLMFFSSYGLYEFQFIMNFDNAEKMKIVKADPEYFDWIFLNLIIASVLTSIFLVLTYPFSRLLKSKNLSHLKVLLILFLVVFVSFFSSGIAGSIIGYNILITGR